jgi:hypothetical protein
MNKIEYDKAIKPDLTSENWPMMTRFNERISGLSEDQLREKITEEQKPMPERLLIKIRLYVDRRRKAGCSEKAIAKAVKKKFNIAVV